MSSPNRAIQQLDSGKLSHIAEIECVIASSKSSIFITCPIRLPTIMAQTPWMQWPFKTWDASAVLAGHDHTYERILDPKDGLLYLVDGLGGAEKYGFGPPLPGSRVRYNADVGALRVSADENQMTFEFVTRHGDVVDRYTLVKLKRDAKL